MKLRRVLQKPLGPRSIQIVKSIPVLWLIDPRSLHQSNCVGRPVPEVRAFKSDLSKYHNSPRRHKWDIKACVPVILLPQVTIAKNRRCVPATAIEEEDINEDYRIVLLDLYVIEECEARSWTIGLPRFRRDDIGERRQQKMNQKKEIPK